MPKKLDLLHWALILIVVMFSLLFWFTPYTYHEYAGVLVRIHRLSGNPDLLNAHGWESMERSWDQDASAKKQTAKEKPPKEYTGPYLIDNLGVRDLDSEDESKRAAARQRLRDAMEKAGKGSR